MLRGSRSCEWRIPNLAGMGGNRIDGGDEDFDEPPEGPPEGRAVRQAPSRWMVPNESGTFAVERGEQGAGVRSEAGEA